MNTPPSPPRFGAFARATAGTAGAVAACTGADALLAGRFHQANLAMVYMLGVLAVAYRLGLGSALATSVLSVLSFDFFFTDPRYSLSIESLQDVFTCGVMLLVSLAISHLTALARRQAEVALRRERQTAALYGLSRDLAVTHGAAGLLGTALRHVTGEFGGSAVALSPDEFGLLRLCGAAGAEARMPPGEATAAALAFRSAQIVSGDARSPLDADVLYVPLVAASRPVGVLRVDRGRGAGPWTPDRVRLLEAFAQQTALAVAGAEADASAGES